MNINEKTLFRDTCLMNGLTITENQLDQLEHYVNELIAWNSKINLISRKDIENIWTYHILHCVSLLFAIEIAEKNSVVDIGTGGGLPGIPIKILCPNISLTCIDSTRKKALAVSQIAKELKLENIKVLWGRAEDVGLQEENFGKFDFVVARAVAPLNDLISWAKFFLKEGNLNDNLETPSINGLKNPYPPVLLSFKGGDLLKEIETAKKQHKNAKVDTIKLSFKGMEQPYYSDKKILIVHL